jgi:hypothetical protein
MFAVPAVSTALEEDATSPGVPAARFGAAFVPVAEGDGLPVGEEPAAADPGEVVVVVGPAEGDPAAALGVGPGAGALPVGLADDGLGVGEGELGRQMMPRMQP